ncbi:MAG: hypothetical protein QNJ81_02555 [Acidimicrobiia bacterium]|nr:hypothetical protein [Acidimicrobiia bacterium]
MRKPSIIVEGPDSSGKSTLVDQLSEHYKIYPFRAGPKPVDMEHAEVCMVYQLQWLSKYPCVWDRFTGISNVCNLPEIEDENDLLTHARYVSEVIKHAVVVVCTRQNLEVHKKAVYESEEDEQRMLKEATIVHSNYIKMAHDLPGAIGYDYEVMEFESLVRRIDHAFSKRIQRPAH